LTNLYDMNSASRISDCEEKNNKLCFDWSPAFPKVCKKKS